MSLKDTLFNKVFTIRNLFVAGNFILLFLFIGVVVKDHLRNGLGAYSTLRLMDWVGNRGHDVRLPYNYLSRGEWDAIFRDTGVTPATWKETLGLYPAPFSLAFDRGLHFIATVVATLH